MKKIEARSRFSVARSSRASRSTAYRLTRVGSMPVRAVLRRGISVAAAARLVATDHTAPIGLRLAAERVLLALMDFAHHVGVRGIIMPGKVRK
jgi:hypothetical protein